MKKISLRYPFGNVYRNKRVLVTGHTGFKGSWLSVWLTLLGADVIGYSAYLPSHPCNFMVCNLKDHISHIKGDVRDIEKIRSVFLKYRPRVVFHLAAQSIVQKSYDEPVLTFDTNLIGTVNVLECIRTCSSVQAAVIITSDKCYQNVEWEWGYRENDILGGNDPYSASKACAELACQAYFKSYFNTEKSPRIATTRAGNVIGGGDWTQDRIIPDCVRALSQGKKLLIRNPAATRPWQYVLEPLSGYLWLGAYLLKKPQDIAGEAFNFGPDSNVIKSVQELVDLFLKFSGGGSWKSTSPKYSKEESVLLKLCCDKALYRLRWQSILNFEEAVRLTAEWYKNFYNNPKNIYKFSCSQIDFYFKKALRENMPWAIGRI